MYRVIKNTKIIRVSMLCISIFLICFLSKAHAAVIFNSSFSVSEDYNDNLFFTETGKETDFTTTLSPFFSIGYTSRNVSVTVGYQGTAQFHAENKSADGYFQSLSIDLELPILNRQIRGVEVTVTEDITFSPELPGFAFGSRSQDKTSDSGTSPAIRRRVGTGVQLNRTDTFENRAGIALSYDWTDRFNTTSSYINVVTRYSGSEFQDRNSDQSAFDAAYRYPVSQRSEWIGSYGVSLTTGNIRNTVIQSLSLAFSHKMTHLLLLTADSGVSFVKDGSPQYTAGTGLFRRFQTGNISIEYTNNISAGLGVVRSVTRSENLSVQLTKELSESVSSYIQGGYSATKSLSGTEINSVSSVAGTGISVQFLEWLEGSLSYDYVKQESKTGTSLGRDGVRNQYMVTLTAIGFPWKILK